MQSHDIQRRATELIQQALPWLPGMAESLSEQEWSTLERLCAISRLSYGTERTRASNGEAGRDILVEIGPLDGVRVAEPVLIECLSASESYYRTLDLVFYGRNEVAAGDVQRKILAAFACLMAVPDMAITVFCLVRSIHILRPPSPAYDVSHSDPQVPFSIFVSLPDDETIRGRLRLAEAILHEAMHLQLTLLESHVPLVARSDAQHYSPWKRAVRPVQGVLHGLYVFGVIDAYLEAASRAFTGDALPYIRERRAQIAEEVGEVAGAGVMDDLTELGTLLYQAVLARFKAAGRQ